MLSKNNPTPTLVNVCLDASGSMHSLQRATIDGFNLLLADQREQPGLCKMSLTQFNSQSQVNFVGRDISLVPMLDTMSYRPGGGTALLDAVGTTIKDTEKWLLNLNEWTHRTIGSSDWKVIVVVFTDGEENTSQTWHLNQPLIAGDDRDVGGLIQWKQKEGWEFMFLGTGGSGWLERSFGRYVAPDRFYSYAATSDSHRNTYAGLSSSVNSTRSTGTFDTSHIHSIPTETPVDAA